jgi:5'-phosphate synthase pdxT subunit
LDSRIVQLPAEAGGEMEAVFIRAPIIRRVGEGVKVLARYEGDPVLVEQGRHLVATFHPELSAESPVHRRFVEGLERG